MPTSSITKNFVISGQEQVEKFVDALEASANDTMPRVADLFYSESNIQYLEKIVRDINSGKAHFSEHDLFEKDE